MLTPSQSLNSVFQKQKPTRPEIEKFKSNIIKMFSLINENESEENHKTLVRDFLQNTYYDPTHHINTKGKTDLVIHGGNNGSHPVNVIIEAKSITNKSQMLSISDINKKALHEMVLYFMRERVLFNNLNIKHLVATNLYEWFIFDASIFDSVFYQNNEFKKQFEQFHLGSTSNSKTEAFYNDIAKPFIANTIEKLEFCYFDLRDITEELSDNNLMNDKKLIPYYKILSKEHLLKLPFSNDSNSLDRKFYNELLHIIGLEEVVVKGKKLIDRKKVKDDASLLEMTIYHLDSRDVIRKYKNKGDYGDTREEQIFGIGLELCLTWINRILFLKLLESQLINYHRGNEKLRFLNFDKIPDFDELNDLFFGVLAKKENERHHLLKEKFYQVPYLNSSLFDETILEEYINITQLRNGRKLPLYKSTVLKDHNLKRIDKDQSIDTLEYIFRFLDSYDFSADGEVEIQEEKKTIINASVLGLIYEKINGYKDGSFFTPGYITMFMCKETIRRAVIQKFNDNEDGTEFDSFKELQNYCHKNDTEECIKRFNNHINSLKICDPAVGSGHFLVSALNEIIAVKSELGILYDSEGNYINYKVKIENDELVVVNNKTNELFQYHLDQNNDIIDNLQTVQKTLFEEKRLIIENCLFGVDINPNSVRICRLRLWIELLKHTYYNENKELEVLPNIDINIKSGNSLISRFEIDTPIMKALKKAGIDINDYKDAVSNYKDASEKENKYQLEESIAKLKGSVRTIVDLNSRTKKRLEKINSILNQETMFENSKDETKELLKEKKSIENHIEELKNNSIYNNSFEWRFEFPEVLTESGDFNGFDVVIGNPPYIQLQANRGRLASDLENMRYSTFDRSGDIYMLFYERGAQLLNQNGNLSFITGSSWMRTKNGKRLRSFLSSNVNLTSLIDFSDCQIFEEATVLTSIVNFCNSKPLSQTKAWRITKKNDEKLDNISYNFENEHSIMNSYPTTSWLIVDRKKSIIKQKVESIGVPLKSWDIEIHYGIKTGLNEAFVIDSETKDKLIQQDPNCSKIIKPLLRGRDIKKYFVDYSDKWLIGTFPSLNINIEEYSTIKYHLKEFLPKLKQTGESYIDNSGKEQKTRKKTNNNWFETQDQIAYHNAFEKEKIIYPNMSKFLPFHYDDSGYYTNQKCFIITGEHLKYLTAVFNSKLFKYCFEESFPELQGNTREMNKVIFETIPILKPNRTQEKVIVDLVDSILAIKKSDSKIDTSKLESDINHQVYSLYDLDQSDIDEIEDSYK